MSNEQWLSHDTRPHPSTATQPDPNHDNPQTPIST